MNRIQFIITHKTAIAFPIIAGIFWGAMLISLLVAWSVQGKPTYWFMKHASNPVYLSDIGATNLQPLFISLVCASCLFHYITVVSMFHLRFKIQGIQKSEKWIGIVSLVILAISQIGIICVSTFNTHVFHPIHMAFLSVFIIAVFIAIVLQTAMIFLLGKHFQKQNSGLSFFQNHYNVTGCLKVFFLIFAVAFAMCFGLIDSKLHRNIVTRFEWILCFWYCFLFLVYVHEYYYLIHYDIKEQATNGANDSSEKVSEELETNV